MALPLLGLALLIEDRRAHPLLWVRWYATQDLFATEFARDATRVALTSTVVTGYIGLLALDAQLQITTDTMNSRAAELTVLRRRAVAGYSSQLDLRQAEGAYEAAARLVPATRLAIVKLESALSVLVGGAPGLIARGDDLDRLGPPEIPHALPAAVLRQRPDIAEARSANRIGRSQSGFCAGGLHAAYSTLGSRRCCCLHDLAESDQSVLVRGSILAPLFQGGALRASADTAAARRDQAAYTYRKIALRAFQEVENALAGVERIGEEQEAATRQVAVVRAALELARRRYRAGYSSYLDQLDAERSLLDAQLQLVDLHRSRLATVVALYQSLGGAGKGRPRLPHHNTLLLRHQMRGSTLLTAIIGASLSACAPMADHVAGAPAAVEADTISVSVGPCLGSCPFSTLQSRQTASSASRESST